MACMRARRASQHDATMQCQLRVQDEPLEELLFSDSCFMTAGKALATQVQQPPALPRLPALPSFLADTAASRAALRP